MMNFPLGMRLLCSNSAHSEGVNVLRSRASSWSISQHGRVSSASTPIFRSANPCCGGMGRLHLVHPRVGRRKITVRTLTPTFFFPFPEFSFGLARRFTFQTLVLSSTSKPKMRRTATPTFPQCRRPESLSTDALLGLSSNCWQFFVCTEWNVRVPATAGKKK